MTDGTLDHHPPTVSTLRVVAYQLLAGMAIVRVVEGVLADFLVVVVDSHIVQKAASLLEQPPTVEQIGVGLLQTVELKLPAWTQNAQIVIALCELIAAALDVLQVVVRVLLLLVCVRVTTLASIQVEHVVHERTASDRSKVIVVRTVHASVDRACAIDHGYVGERAVRLGDVGPGIRSDAFDDVVGCSEREMRSEY